MRARCRMIVGALLFAWLTLAVPVRAELLLSYEGDAFPELDGWDGYTVIDPLSTRSVEDGIFSIHAPVGADRSDYERDVPLTSDAIFYEWSVRTTGDGGAVFMGLMLLGETVNSEILVGVRSDSVFIALIPNSGVFVGEILTIPLDAGEFHTFRLESNGALHTMYLDGSAIASEVLQPPGGLNVRTRLAFLHSKVNIPTTGQWDYVRFGVIPEPATAALLGLGLLATIRRRRGVVV